MKKFKDYQIWYRQHAQFSPLWRLTTNLGVIKARTEKEAHSKLCRKTHGFFTSISFVAVESGLDPNFG